MFNEGFLFIRFRGQENHFEYNELNFAIVSNFRYKFTYIAVDPQIKTPGGKTYDVIFVGTGEYDYSISQPLENRP